MDRSARLSAPLRLREKSNLAKVQRRPAPIKARARKRRRLVVRTLLTTFIISLVSAAIFFVASYRSYAKIVDARLAHGYLTSRAGIYAAPRVLRTGQKYSPAGLAMALRRAGYIESDDATEVWNGSFSIQDRAIEIRPNSSGGYPSQVRLSFDSGERITELTGDEVTLDSFTLAPEPLTSDSMKTGARAQLSFKDIPPVLVHAITSIEDRRFFDHHGVDIFGIGRALIRNAGDERIGQGGSTITQQLVRRVLLPEGDERTLPCPSSCTVNTSSGLPAATATAARTSMRQVS